MKRGAQLRRTGFTPAQRATRLTRAVTARKRAKVSPEETAARKTVALRSQGICEGCGQRPAHDWAHRVGRGQQGAWCASNGLHLCNPGGCHDRAHASPLWARERGWILLSTQNPEREPALLAGRGWVLLNNDGTTERVEKRAA